MTLLPGIAFAKGDTVKLKTGGPAMVVIGVYPNDTEPKALECEWFDKQDRLHKKLFLVEHLVSAE